MIKEGTRVVLIFFLISLVLFSLGFLNNIFHIFSSLSALLTLFLVYFFRDPEREVKINDSILYSPADGTVFEIKEDKDFYCIRIFMSVFNVHIQRAPADGIVKKIEYKKGKFNVAGKKDTHILNERNLIEIYLPQVDDHIRITQIAGILARRIICWTKEGLKVKQGQKIGAILLGSQVDFEFPKSKYKILIRNGYKVFAGTTPIALVKKIEE